MTALAFLCFAESNIDLAIIETGLGGRLDATNIVQPRVSVITQIALDHTRTLGNSLSEIAREKGGIIKRGVPVVAKPEDEKVHGVLQSIADEKTAPWHEPGYTSHDQDGLNLHTPQHTYKGVQCGLSGRHQNANALLATRAAELLFADIASNPAPVRSGLTRVATLAGLRGRLETLHEHPRVVLDVAHNPSSLSAALKYMETPHTLHVVLSLMQDKDAGSIAILLRTHGARVYTCDLDTPRAWNADALAHKFAAHNVRIGGSGTLEDMWRWVMATSKPHDAILICGSHYLAGAFLSKIVNNPVALCVEIS